MSGGINNGILKPKKAKQAQIGTGSTNTGHLKSRRFEHVFLKPVVKVELSGRLLVFFWFFLIAVIVILHPPLAVAASPPTLR